MATDYDDSYTQINRADGSIYNTTDATLGKMIAVSSANKKAFKLKAAFTSSTTSTAKLQGLGFVMTIKDDLFNA